VSGVAKWDPTSDLARKLETQRSMRRQLAALAVFVAACVAWGIAPLHEPEPIVAIVAGIGSLLLLGEGIAARHQRDGAMDCADDLILSGFLGKAGTTPIDRAVSSRVERIQRQRARRRLAEDLRWRVRLAEGACRPSPGLIRASAYPPLGRQRPVYLNQASLILDLAAEVESHPVDPRALVILHRIVCLPPAEHDRDAQAREDELRADLRVAAALLDHATGRSRCGAALDVRGKPG
jgi:hypothetical protein